MTMTPPDDPKFTEHVDRLRRDLPLLTTPAELDALPEWSIILSEVFNNSSALLCKVTGTWDEEYVEGIGFDPCWYTFYLDAEGRIEMVDDQTPDLPALLLVCGPEDDDDEDEELLELDQIEDCIKRAGERS